MLVVLLLLTENSGVVSEWRRESDPKTAGLLFSQELLHRHKGSRSLCLSLDLRHSREEQDQEIVSLYKRDGVRWTSPFTGTLKGRTKNAAEIGCTVGVPFM